jgi:hypothetical protein
MLVTCIWDWYASDNKLPGTPRGSSKKPKAGKSPTCRLWMADANSHISCCSHAITLLRPCHIPAMALKGRFQKGIVVAQQGNGMACVNQTRPHCVNQMGKTQSNTLAEWHDKGTAWEQHGNGMVCVNQPLVGEADTQKLVFCWPCISTYACNETNLMHYLSSVYSTTIPPHVLGLLVAHHQEVTMCIWDSWYVLYVLVSCQCAWLKWNTFQPGPLTVD